MPNVFHHLLQNELLVEYRGDKEIKEILNLKLLWVFSIGSKTYYFQISILDSIVNTSLLAENTFS